MQLIYLIYFLLLCEEKEVVRLSLRPRGMIIMHIETRLYRCKSLFFVNNDDIFSLIYLMIILYFYCRK